MDTIAAYTPGHITGIFYIEDTSSEPLERGSLGAGFSIDLGVTVSVTTADRRPGPPVLLLDGIPNPDLSVSRRLYEHFIQSSGKTPEQQLKIDHIITAPKSSGFGTSGAGALSLSYALNRYFGHPFSHEQAAHIAHLVEIECKTGLGTVIGEYFGGFEIRTKPGAPGVGAIDQIPYPPGLKAVFAVRGPYLTSTALSDPAIRENINHAGRNTMELLRANPDIPNFLSCSRSFAESTKLMTPWVESALELLDKRGIIGSMLMFGEAVFTLTGQENSSETEAVFREVCRRTEPDLPVSVFSTFINSTGGTYL